MCCSTVHFVQTDDFDTQGHAWAHMDVCTWYYNVLFPDTSFISLFYTSFSHSFYNQLEDDLPSPSCSSPLSPPSTPLPLSNEEVEEGENPRFAKPKDAPPPPSHLLPPQPKWQVRSTNFTSCCYATFIDGSFISNLHSRCKNSYHCLHISCGFLYLCFHLLSLPSTSVYWKILLLTP